MISDPEIQSVLKQGLAELPFSVNQQQVAQLVCYLHLLNKWNATHNLTAIRDPKEQVIRHILDCLSVLPFIPKTTQTVLDIGSGAGLPALVIAVMRTTKVVAVESVHKKSAFIRQAAVSMNLKNVEVVTERVENWQSHDEPDIIISRAMASVDDLLNLTDHLGQMKTLWMLMKGKESETLTQQGFHLLARENIHVPLLHAERQLLLIKRNELS